MTGRRPSFMSSCAATMPEIPAPTMATSSPRRSWGIEPSPAGCAIQSSKGKGKSGPNMVTGRCALSAAKVNSFAMSAALHHLVHGNGEIYSQLPREPHVTHHYSPGGLRALSELLPNVGKCDACIWPDFRRYQRDVFELTMRAPTPGEPSFSHHRPLFLAGNR